MRVVYTVRQNGVTDIMCDEIMEVTQDAIPREGDEVLIPGRNPMKVRTVQWIYHKAVVPTVRILLAERGY